MAAPPRRPGRSARPDAAAQAISSCRFSAPAMQAPAAPAPANSIPAARLRPGRRPRRTNRSTRPFLFSLLLAAPMNRHHFHLSLSFAEGDGVTILRNRLTARLGIDRAEDVGDRYLSITACPVIVKLESSGGVIETPARGYLLRPVVDC